MSGLAKLQLLISLDNKLKAGFDTAKRNRLKKQPDKCNANWNEHS